MRRFVLNRKGSAAPAKAGLDVGNGIVIRKMIAHDFNALDIVD